MIERLELRTVREVRQYTGAGEGCTCCHSQIQQIIDKHHCTAEAVI